MAISKSVLAIAILIVAFSMPPANAAGIDCTKPSSATDHMICQSPALMVRDRIMQDLYAAALKQDDENKIRAQQREWVQQLPTCGDAACLQELYDVQIGNLLGTKGGLSLSKHFMDRNDDGDQGDLTIFGPVNGFLAVELSTIRIGAQGGQAGDIYADSTSGLISLRNGHGRLVVKHCTIDFNRLDASTWRTKQSGVCQFASDMNGTYRR